MADKRYIIEDNAAAGIRMVFVLIVINVIVYILQQLPGGEEMSSSFALSASAVREGEIWRLFSYMFLHAQGNILHILLNMWGLYLFGGVTAAALGPRRFLALYFLSGLAGALFWLIFNWDTSVLVVGASGAVFGVMMAAAMLAPNVQIMLLLPPIPMKLKTFIVVYAILEILGTYTDSQIAHLAHLGGLLAAYFYIKALFKNAVWDPFDFLKPKSSDRLGSKPPPGWSVKQSSDRARAESDGEEQVSQYELDRLLDKISASGINSLSELEISTLKRAREQMKSH